jgi:hypothetical protein
MTRISGMASGVTRTILMVRTLGLSIDALDSGAVGVG